MAGQPEQLKSKSGKKGGTAFPKYSLSALLPSLKSLVSKTHTNTITIEQLNAGVFNVSTNSTVGKIKYSALKQFQLIEGDYKKIRATELCSKISLSSGEELQAYLFEAFSKVKILIDTFSTFQNDKVEKSRIASFATSTLKVHPDFKDDFVKVLTDSGTVAGICSVEGNNVLFSHLVKSSGNEDPSENLNLDLETKKEIGEIDAIDTVESKNDKNENRLISFSKEKASNVNVTIEVNSSMDSEKLEKMLKLLQQYGAI